MQIFELNDKVLTKEEKDRCGIRSVSIISETDILYPRLIIKYEDGMKKYVMIEDIIDTDVKFRKLLEENIPELK